MRFSMYNWFKRAKPQPTPEQNIVKSFFIKGRWVKESSAVWKDTVTGATLTDGTRGVWINGVQQGDAVEHAFTRMVFQPMLDKIDVDKENLEKLYADNT